MFAFSLEENKEDQGAGWDRVMEKEDGSGSGGQSPPDR
jgi:hypothetical protein